MYETLVQLILALAICYLLSRLAYKSRRPTVPLPPGPPPDPFWGHLNLLSSISPETVHKWSQKYGSDVVRLNCLGQSLIFLDSNQAAIDLLEKRSALYSCRPNTVVYKLMGWDPDVVFLPYGPYFRKQRKIFHTSFTPKACIEFQPVQLQNAHLLIKGLLANEGNHDHLLSRFTTAIAMRIAYGHQILSDDDEYIQLTKDSGAAMSRGGMPGGTLVDCFPILQHFPSWFPGTHYANVAREWKWAVRKLIEFPYETVQMQMADGTPKPSFLVTQLECLGGRPPTREESEDMKTAAAVIYAAGADTTRSTLTNFFLAMLLYPECQERGQEEVDRVVGGDRLPTFEDRDFLPYVGCLVQELLRWHPVTPLGVPHRSTSDDIYEGMFIPKGSYIFANTAAMSLDENTYANPTVFNPSRFLPNTEGGGGEPPFGPAWGFGRRACPGRHLASTNIWIAVVSILSTLHISKAKDEKGHDVTPSAEFEIGLISHPKPFPCIIEVRSERARHLIIEAVAGIN